MVVQKRKAEGMERRIQPAIHPVPMTVSRNDTPGLGINVVPCAFLVVHEDTNNRQRPLASPVEIVEVLLIDDFDIEDIRI